MTSWIWSDAGDPAPAGRFTWFRTVIDLDRIPAEKTLRVAADSTARVMINGTTVLRKVTRFHQPEIRAEVIDVGRWLRPGRNVVVVLHHSWGPITTFQRTAAGRAGLWLEGGGPTPWLQTGTHWRWRAAEEFASTPQFLGVHDHTPRIRYPVHLDASRSPEPGLHDPDFDDHDWPAAIIVDDGPWPDRPAPVETPPQREYDTRPGGVVAAGTARHGTWSGEPTDRPSLLASAGLAPDPALARAAGALVPGAADGPFVITGDGTRYVTVDFHRPVHGYPYLEAELDHGTAELRLGYGEIVTSAYDGSTHLRSDGWVDVDGVVATGYADLITITPGRRRYELPDERTARWLTVHLTGPGTITVHELGLVSSQHPIEPVGSFRCGDRQLEQLVELCLIHAEVTMSDAYVDTPGREDGQWIEDARPRALIAERWFGDTALRRLMIRTLAEGQNEHGDLHPFYPSNYPFPSSPYDWSVQWVAMLHDDYRWHRDPELIKDYLPRLARYWDAVLEHLGEDGLWRTGHVFADIRVNARVPEGGSSGVITPWIIDRLGWSAELARAVGDHDHADRWDAAAASMRDAFRRHHLVDHPDFGVIVADRWGPALSTAERGYSQAGQAMPLLDGLLTDDEARQVIEAVFPAPDGSPPAGVGRWNNPTWSYRVLRGLTRHGFGARAVAHLKERYAPYLPGHPRNPTPVELQGPYGGPLPEYWISREDLGLAGGEINPAQPVDVTGSHGWGAMPLLWLHDSLLGVELAEPGGDRLIIRPTTAGLPYVSGWTVTPHGAVQVHLDPQQDRLVITLPAGVVADVTVPEELGGGTAVITGPGRFDDWRS